jgi:hypothetical protein
MKAFPASFLALSPLPFAEKSSIKKGNIFIPLRSAELNKYIKQN